jgi:hypothetical protein
LLVLLPLMALAISSCIPVPLLPEYSYQGRLLDSSGNPVPDGNYEMTYSIYNVETGGTEVFSQTQTIPVEDGLFTTAVGPSTDLDPQVFAQPAWMEVTVEGETLAPRQRLQGAPFAFSLAPGAVVQGPETRERSFGSFDDTGSVLTVWNLDSSATGGHALLALNQAAASGADRDITAALLAIASGGVNSGATQTGAYGAIIRSEHYRGMYARSAPSASYYAAVFDSPAGIQLIGGGTCSGCALAYMGYNAGGAAIEPGDFVTISGVKLDADLNVPVMQVEKAQTGDSAVIGVAMGAATRRPISERYGAQVGGFDQVGGSAESGSFVSVVVQGLVQANVGDAGAAQLGQQLQATAARPAIGLLMSAPESNGKAWVMLGGQ